MTQPIGRRALPEDPLPETQVSPARRATPETAESEHPRRAEPQRLARHSEVSNISGARRGESPTTTTRSIGPWRWLAALAAVLTIAIVTGALVFGTKNTTKEPSSMVPSITQSSAAASPKYSASKTPSASPSPTPTNPPIKLNDITLQLPNGWELYGDETVQDDRRLIRARNAKDEVRIQVVTLTSVGEDLRQACTDLLAQQVQGYADVSQNRPSDLTVAPGGQGVECSFTAVRAKDQVRVDAEFQVLRRQSDGESLVIRTVLAQQLPASAAARSQATALGCDLSTSFGVILPNCSATPAPADG